MNATQEDIQAGLAGIVNEMAGIPVKDIVADKCFANDLDVDPLSMVEVVVAKEKFGMTISDDTTCDAFAYTLANR
ncbi:phosphopantetheine-binding protein [Streptomyces chartreusis]